MSPGKPPFPMGNPWRFWAIAAFFYLYGFMQRISPAVMTPELMQHFQISAQALGSLSAFYYYAYACCQIPAGIYVDRYPLRTVLTLACLTTVVGSYGLSTTSDLLSAKLARSLIGFGSAFAFVGCLKLATVCLPQRFPLIVGLTNFCGVLGAVLAGAPLSLAIETIGWRGSIHLLTVLGMVVVIFLWWGIPESPCELAKSHKAVHRPVLSDLKRLLSTRATWLTAGYGALLVAPIAALPELWSVPFFVEAQTLSRGLAALATSMVFIGIACAGPLIGFFASKGLAYIKLMRYGTLLALSLLLLILYGPPLPFSVLCASLFLFGAATSNMLLCFSLVTEQHPVAIRGMALGFTNMIVMAGGTLFQSIVGYLLDHYGARTLDAGIPHFSTTDFRIAFSVLPLCLLVALVFSLGLKRSPA